MLLLPGCFSCSDPHEQQLLRQQQHARKLLLLLRRRRGERQPPAAPSRSWSGKTLTRPRQAPPRTHSDRNVVQELDNVGANIERHAEAICKKLHAITTEKQS